MTIVDDFREPQSILFAGDWHGNGPWAQKVIHHARKQGADTIVQLGDFGLWVQNEYTDKYLRHLQRNLTECNITLYWVDGNHEDHSRIVEQLAMTGDQPWSFKRCPNIVHLPRGHRWRWWGREWLAMGGAHSVDRLARTRGRSWWDEEHISDEQFWRAINGGRADIMLCHDCPAGVAIPGIGEDPELDALNSPFPLSELRLANQHRQKLRQICDVVQPDILLHGHYHVRYRNLLAYPHAEPTLVEGLAHDGSHSLTDNTMLLERQ